MEERLDGYFNTVIGHGLRTRDPFAWGRFGARRGLTVDYQQMDDIYTYSGIAQRIIRVPADEAVRAGFDVVADGIEVTDNARLQSVMEDLNIQQVFANALSWDRLYGGCVVLLMVNDGGALEDPLNVDGIQNIEQLLVYSPSDVIVTQDSYYNDPKLAVYGTPQFYTIHNVLNGQSFIVHESRTLVFRGGTVSNLRRAMRNGWGGTVLEQITDDLRHYGVGLDMALMALSRLSQGVLKLDGLSAQLQTDEGENNVRKRLHMIDMGRHLLNTLALDKLDEYGQYNLTLTGVEKIIERFEEALSGATDIPATVLFGRSPDGLNATGQADFENYYNMVGRVQQRILRPKLVRLIELIGQAKDYKVSLPEEYNIVFRPLWNPSDKERAETERALSEARKKSAEAAQFYVALGALDAMEVRDTLARGDDYKIDTSLDEALRRKGDEE